MDSNYSPCTVVSLFQNEQAIWFAYINYTQCCLLMTWVWTSRVHLRVCSSYLCNTKTSCLEEVYFKLSQCHLSWLFFLKLVIFQKHVYIGLQTVMHLFTVHLMSIGPQVTFKLSTDFFHILVHPYHNIR